MEVSTQNTFILVFTPPDSFIYKFKFSALQPLCLESNTNHSDGSP